MGVPGNRKAARGELEMAEAAAVVVDIYLDCAFLEVAVEAEVELILMDHKPRGAEVAEVVGRFQIEILPEDLARTVEAEEGKQHREVPEGLDTVSSLSPGNGGMQL